MKFGYFGFNNGPLANANDMTAILQALEEHGFESAWTGEHIVVIDPQEAPSPVPPHFPFVDTVAALSFAAAITSKIKLGSGIILLAQRNPVVLAKELASVDVLSAGRLLFGIGVGYVEREFQAIGVPFEERGARVDEHIEAMRALWTMDNPEFEGRFTQFAGIQAKPTPMQTPHPPVIVGGMSKAGYARALRAGDGWYGFNQTEPEVAASIEGLKAAAERQGIPERFGKLEISVTPRGAITPERVEKFASLGVHRLILLPGPIDTGSGGLADTLRFIETHAKQFH